jgi:hypothetical protein
VRLEGSESALSGVRHTCGSVGEKFLPRHVGLPMNDASGFESACASVLIPRLVVMEMEAFSPHSSGLSVPLGTAKDRSGQKGVNPVD